jgi:hypothetical protein
MNAFRMKRPEKWRTKSWILFHDNAPAHRYVVVTDFLAKNYVTTFRHPPYPSEQAAGVFNLFRRLKTTLKGQRFCDVADVITNETEDRKRFLKMVSRNVSNTFAITGRSA